MGKDLHENLKEARKEANLTQKDVADTIGVAKSTYSLYESGNREPNVITLKKIASVLKVSSDKLLGIEEPTTIAAHLDTENLTQGELEDIAEYIEFIRNRRK